MSWFSSTEKSLGNGKDEDNFKADNNCYSGSFIQKYTVK